MTREEALIKTLEIYAETDKQVSQDFYQSLCKAALRSIKNKLLESKLDSTDFTKFRQQIGKALNMKGLLDEDIPPTEFILAEIDRLTAENKELNTEREWWENLTRKGNIGTKDVPSLHDYIVQLQAELKELVKADKYHRQRISELAAEIKAKDELLKKAIKYLGKRDYKLTKEIEKSLKGESDG